MKKRIIAIIAAFTLILTAGAGVGAAAGNGNGGIQTLELPSMH
ncbi:hypothetical protein DFO73_10465 [Cytobacillus oceanisediminis]|uniref:Uncharacterized protein n=1 Tax=Cytobacillus oceanisediminis TaxID=665099 RepID=A0A2V2ZYB8_9BACI|nr:hypothetical protein [Cytobacillus oceanisediminis]PWW29434.1 hypothetical protein DFO73_10465 [Cytobacillus oceanisediminis]